VSGPSQPKVEGEQWSDDRIRGFLSLYPLDGTNPDYHVLLQAYQHMVPEFFSRFLVFFSESGRDINALSPDNETIHDRVGSHRRSQAYMQALEKHGAKPAAEINA